MVSVSNRAVIVGVAGLMAIATAHYALAGGWQIGDAGHYHSVATNLAAGGDFALGMGDEPFAPASPLWVVLLAIAAALGIEATVAAKLLGAGFSAAAVVVTARLAGDAMPRVRGVPLVAAAVMASGAVWLRWASSGMEWGLFVFLLALGTWRLLREERSGGFLWSVPAFGLLVATRPEGLLYAVVVAAVMLARQPRRLLTWSVAFSIPVGGYFVARYGWFGHWLAPGEILIQQRFDWWTERGATYLFKWALLPEVWLLSPLAAFGVFRGRSRVLFACLGMVGVTLTAAMVTHGHWTAHQVMAPVVLPMAVMYAYGVGEAVNAVRETRRAAVGAVALALPLIAGALTLAALPRYDTSVTALEARAAYVEALFAENGVTGPVACLDPEPMYGSVCEGIDYSGRAHYGFAAHRGDKAFAAQYVLEELKPAYIHLHGAWARVLGIDRSPTFQRDYVEVPGYQPGDAVHEGNYLRRDLIRDWSER